MSDKQREQLLELVFADGGKQREKAGGSGFDPAVLADVIAGLVFAQRPINSAAKAAAEAYDLGPRGPFILSLISRGVCYPKDLAMILRVGRSLVTAEIVRLTEAGLISAQAGDDRRRSRLSLTPSGERVNLSVRAQIVDLLTHSLSGYTADQLLLFSKMLREVGRVGAP